ncbi:MULTISPECIES: hypothetical protein [Phaeobacter]|uniref:Uncharacterized protein n=3 Tax=Phaeobacter TaxID=302485 RepID=A0AAC9Z706_9RHOB|nr:MULTISPECIES: hypothetical protein [Phaeobacter]AHD08450.1 hypothetical protein Gal_00665 [Phaeobacter gallaeciensis DSM 26640]APG46188.1 hypothetical protein PhaeoP97_00750 [Phaeobacter porticola]ATE91716.1 hypothetical protein PhaeoP11_00661 [Phaeobacter gallaeciensis]ATE98460.1 hypothetical protein PhaeoP73_03183 [Phaeobacter gallaeciensis]ATF00332.1 hypothetical protein PhaeoP75_00662 [Phaeobacter gallaeciensis]
MKAMLTGFAAIIVIAAGANFALDQAGFASQEVHSGPSVRLD